MSRIVQIKEWKHGDKKALKKRLQEAGIFQFTELPSRKSLKKAILEKRVKVNGKLSTNSTWVLIGDEIELLPQKHNTLKLTKTELKLNHKIKILHEDHDILAVVKPPGINTNGNSTSTLENIVRNQLKNSDIYPAHRLDKDTHGIVIFYKNITSSNWLCKAFEERKIHKEYIALVCGNFPTHIHQISTKINAKNSLTKVEKLGEINWPIHGTVSLIKAVPITGRKHQIRVHLQSVGYPVVGDPIYSSEKRYKGSGLFLSCIYIRFKNQRSGELLTIKTYPHKKFLKALSKLDLNCETL